MARGAHPRVFPGDVYGRLLVVAETAERKHDERVFLCRCECGAEKAVKGSYLRNGTTKSCGCLHREGTHRTHGHTAGCDSPTYRTWLSMRSRCKYPSSANYKWYGGRGITVCDRWHAFENFLSDMGERPEGMTLDRIDPDGDYEPSNCRWATAKEQRSNQRAVAEAIAA